MAVRFLRGHLPCHSYLSRKNSLANSLAKSPTTFFHTFFSFSPKSCLFWTTASAILSARCSACVTGARVCAHNHDPVFTARKQCTSVSCAHAPRVCVCVPHMCLCYVTRDGACVCDALPECGVRRLLCFPYCLVGNTRN